MRRTSARRRSRPSRARGLKQKFLQCHNVPPNVAPLAGAWIETRPSYTIDCAAIVAPLAGAWIETSKSSNSSHHCTVAPLAGAWIETLATRSSTPCNVVAPLAGAWIETSSRFRSRVPLWSRPSRARGLKHLLKSTSSGILESRPSRARGLKRSLSNQYCRRACAKRDEISCQERKWSNVGRWATSKRGKNRNDDQPKYSRRRTALPAGAKFNV